MQKGYLVVGHGTRDVAGQAEFRQVVRMLGESTAIPVASGFLELAEPTIAQGLAELAAGGVRRVIVVPLLLFTAAHAKNDVPTEVAEAAQRLGLEVVGQSAALGLHPKLLELSRKRFWEALEKEIPSATRIKPDLEETLLLMVGRGGSDPEALEEMWKYTQSLSMSLDVRCQTAFVALAAPMLREALAELESRGPRTIVVVPHLLFQGEVLATINNVVAKERSVEQNRIVANALGPDPLLIEAVLERMASVDTP
jgi:sirohydrochlorin cobaltochelatase